ncbi:MAG: hypothetical protein KF700_03995 [Hyphomonadaceae bacterium]|nr:hypothetical protein [Hyphomonadaceae bacterium]
MPIRVAQWSSGRVGKACMRAVLARPREFTLVGLGVYDPAKIGVDVGEILGGEKLGVAAVGVKDVASLEADCVVHTPKGEFNPDQTVDEVAALLASGKNVCSTGLMSLIHPRLMAPAHREKIEAACAKGNTTFHATGINPGFFAEVVTMVLSGICQDVERVYAAEIYDYSAHTSRATIVDLLKFGQPMNQVSRLSTARVSQADPGLQILADAMAVSIDEVTQEFANTPAEQSFEITATHIEAGTNAGYRNTFRAFERGKERICFEFIGRAASHVAPHWPAPAREGLHRWENRLYGTPNVVSSIEAGMDDAAGTSGSTATGMRAVNAVAAVCAAPPGIATILDLGMLRAPMRALT